MWYFIRKRFYNKCQLSRICTYHFMRPKSSKLPFLIPERDRRGAPIHRQFYEAVRAAILAGELGPGTRLPSSRAIAEQYSVARLTVLTAFDQLLAEGYLETRRGSGTFVAAAIPEDLLQLGKNIAPPRNEALFRPAPELSGFSRRAAEAESEKSRFQIDSVPVPFKNGLTAVREFPFEIWERITTRVIRRSRFELKGYGDAAGFEPLRKAIADHLAASRGVRCSVDQVFITSGAQQALDLTTRVLLDVGDKVWIEDPCYREAYSVFRTVGAVVRPVSPDREGFDIETASSEHEPAKLVYVTPSHQYPTGVTMSLGRRLKLLEWAHRNNSWIIEDDYNSEFRYAGRPIASLQNLDEVGRVIYVGTFSKTIFPALRLGCLVVPRELIDPFRIAKNLADTHSPIIEQAVLTEFISDGHFARHLRRMRRLYQKRRDALIASAARELAGLMKVAHSDSGMHLIGWLADGFDDAEVAARGEEAGLTLTPLSSYCIGVKLPPAIVLGYTAFDEKEIETAVLKIRRVLEV